MVTDFSTQINRRGSGSYKWDSAGRPDIIPLWVADMDFPTAPCITEALHRRVDHRIFGYTFVDPEFYNSTVNWFKHEHGFTFCDSDIIYTSGVVPAVSAIIKALTRPSDGVIVQTPVYNCFFSSIRNNGCLIIENRLTRIVGKNGTFSFEMDFDDLEKQAARPEAKLMILCNPANPAGRIWTLDELTRVYKICKRHGVRVISDEIHCELTAPGSSYIPYGPIDPDAIICLSPSKAFNTAGLQIANIICRDPESRKSIDRAININEVCDVNPFGVVALKASYTPEGKQWLTELRGYIWRNYRLMTDYLADKLPLASISSLEATYLPLIDVTAYSNDSAALEQRLLDEGKVWVNSSEHYGCSGYLRINIACPWPTLEEGLRRITSVLAPSC